MGCSDSSQDDAKRKTVWSSFIARSYEQDNELYQTINSGLIRLEYFDIFKDSKEHLERLKTINQPLWSRTSFDLD